MIPLFPILWRRLAGRFVGVFSSGIWPLRNVFGVSASTRTTPGTPSNAVMSSDLAEPGGAIAIGQTGWPHSTQEQAQQDVVTIGQCRKSKKHCTCSNEGDPLARRHSDLP